MSDTRYVIQSLDEFDDDQPLYWHNTQGWVRREDADVFPDTDRNLPIGGTWVSAA